MQPETLKFLQSNGSSEKDIQTYDEWFQKLRKCIHPQIPLAPVSKEYYLPAPDEALIYVQEYIPDKCQIIVLCQHGNTIQGDLFIPLADYLTAHNIGLIAVDNRGHGRSGPGRGIFNKPELIFPVYEAIMARHPEKQWHLHGESLGCIMMTWFLSQRTQITPEIKSIILQVPPYRLRAELFFRSLVPILKLAVILLQIISLNRPFLPNRPNFNNPYFHEFHRIDQIDPIRSPKMAAIHLRSDISLMAMFPSLVKNIKIPLLILQGTGDGILDPNGALSIMKVAKRSPRRRIHLYKGSDHSLFNDKYSQSIYNDILIWIQRTSKNS